MLALAELRSPFSRRLGPESAPLGWHAASALSLSGDLPPGGTHVTCLLTAASNLAPPCPCDRCTAALEASGVGSIGLFVDGRMVDVVGGSLPPAMLPRMPWTLRRHSAVIGGRADWPGDAWVSGSAAYAGWRLRTCNTVRVRVSCVDRRSAELIRVRGISNCRQPAPFGDS